MTKRDDPRFDEARAIRRDLEAFLGELGRKHSVRFKVGAIAVGMGEARTRLTWEKVNENGMPANFETQGKLYGLDARHFGATFQARGEVFRVVGLDCTKPKFCIQTERLSDGRRFSWPETIVKRLSPPPIGVTLLEATRQDRLAQKTGA